MTLECNARGGVNLSQGICDLEMPEVLRQAAHQVLDEGFQIYTRMDGLASLRNEIARDLARRGHDPDPEGEIVVSAGATGAFLAAALATLEPGDEVLLFEPFYGYHRTTLESIGVQVRTVPLTPPSWEFDLDQVRQALGPRTRAILVCSPSNPTGKVFTRRELEGLRDLILEFDLLAFTDEIYEHFLYDGHTHIPFATLEGMRDRTVTISGYSKTFAITGWRIGYLFAPRALAKAAATMNDMAFVCAPSVLQEAVARALSQLGPEYFEGLSQTTTPKRDMICQALDEAGLPPVVPQGSYYVLAEIQSLPGANARERTMHLLETTGVAAVPGSSFTLDPRDGDHLARFCFAKRDPELARAVEGLSRLRKGLP